MSEHPLYEVGDRVHLVFGEKGTVMEVRGHDHYGVDVDGRGRHVMHAKHLGNLIEREGR